MSERGAEEAFLLELTDLTRKYGIAIAGCGCCGSPYLHRVKTTDPRAGYGYAGPLMRLDVEGSMDNIRWLSPASGHEWERYNQTIVRRGHHD